MSDAQGHDVSCWERGLGGEELYFVIFLRRFVGFHVVKAVITQPPLGDF